MLYYKVSLWTKMISCGSHKPRGLQIRQGVNLHTFLKEDMAQDVKFTQAVLGALPKDNMQAYFHERNADTEYQPNPFGGDQADSAQTNAFSAMNLAASAHGQSAFDVPEGEERTSDIFGKHLRQFKLLDETNESSTPLVFWLLAGFFRKNSHFLRTEGLFRVAAPEADVRELEIHMS